MADGAAVATQAVGLSAWRVLCFFYSVVPVELLAAVKLRRVRQSSRLLMPRFRCHATLPLLVACAGACTRYEFKPIPCPTPPPSRSAIAWQRSVPSGVIAGQVVRVDSLRRVDEALVELLGSDQELARRSGGAFRFDSLPAGHYTLRIRRLGYEPIERTLDITRDSGATVLVALEQRGTTLDGCGIIGMEVRKPWWKFW